jgi:2-keto-3-deoxy-L-rhamnonate aldolase RhmA
VRPVFSQALAKEEVSMSRLFRKLESGQLALGAYTKGAPHLMPGLAKAGFDFVRPDMMFSSIDWKELDHIIRASLLADLTPVVRIPNNPWFGGTDNLQCAVDAGRAFSIGAEVVQVSVASARQVEALLHVSKDWHRTGAGEFPSSKDELKDNKKKIDRQALLLPSIESAGAIKDIKAIAQLEGMRAIFIACTDFAEQLGHPFDYEHPQVWAAFDRIAQLARDNNLTLVANTGYVYKTMDDNARRVKDLYDHGAQVVMVQGVEFLLEVLCREMMDRIQDRLS